MSAANPKRIAPVWQSDRGRRRLELSCRDGNAARRNPVRPQLSRARAPAPGGGFEPPDATAGGVFGAAGCNGRRVDLVVVDVTPSEEQDFTEFVRAHGDQLLRFARLLVPDTAEAEDALQTALLRLIRHWSRRLDSPQAYVRATLVNLAKDRGRRRHLVPVPVEAAVGPDLPAAGTDHAEAIAAQAYLDQILTALPPRQRVTVVLRVVDGLSEAETADLMRCSPGTVKSNLARGLHKVRALLEPSLTSAEETTL